MRGARGVLGLNAAGAASTRGIGGGGRRQDPSSVSGRSFHRADRSRGSREGEAAKFSEPRVPLSPLLGVLGVRETDVHVVMLRASGFNRGVPRDAPSLSTPAGGSLPRLAGPSPENRRPRSASQKSRHPSWESPKIVREPTPRLQTCAPVTFGAVLFIVAGSLV